MGPVMESPLPLPWDALVAARGERPAGNVAFREIWVCGSLEGLRLPAVAIVGTRGATAYGKRQAREFASALGAAGCCIVSGLALGIDAAAHEGALEAGSFTLGVLGGGHAAFFPSRNIGIAERMLGAGGAVISPYPPEHHAQPFQFLARNSVVAALVDAVVVIEAPARSGALNTASWAAGRIPVFAVPGDVDRKHVAGCHALIRDGAILARSAQDVLDDLRLNVPAQRMSEPLRPVAEDPLQLRILEILAAGETTLDALLERSQAQAAPVLASLSILELNGCIEARRGRRYVLR